MAKNNRYKAAIGTFKAEISQASALPVERMAAELQGAIERAELLAPGSDNARVEALDIASKFISSGYGRRKVEQYMGRKPATLQRYFTVARVYVKQTVPVPAPWKNWQEAWEAHSLRELTEMVKRERVTPTLSELLRRGYARAIKAVRTSEYVYDGTNEQWHSTNLREVLGNFINTGEVHEHALTVGQPVTDEQTLKMLGAMFLLEEENN